nr:FKBP-type peptidyl-prolyl cis-trans isomerase [Candidatus Sigynarchaeota archaeon]
MPKPNPKRSSTYARYYKRARSQQTTERVKDTSAYKYIGIGIVVIVAMVIVVVVLTAPLVNQIHAQKNDVVSIYYIGTFDNGTIFDSGEMTSIKIGSNSLLAYFDQQLLGMVPGVKKTFAIPPEFGYQTSHGSQYARFVGKTLHFEATITKLERDGKILYDGEET